jgi:hypothetical protein
MIRTCPDQARYFAIILAQIRKTGEEKPRHAGEF